MYVMFPRKDGPINLIMVTNPTTCVSVSLSMWGTDVCMPVCVYTLTWHTHKYTHTWIRSPFAQYKINPRHPQAVGVYKTIRWTDVLHASIICPPDNIRLGVTVELQPYVNPH